MNLSMIDIYAEGGQWHRYVLGKNGNNPLYVIALNPSVATRDKFDQTILKAFGLANILGYDGCIIFNLISYRDSNSDKLPIKYDYTNVLKNTHEILNVIKQSKKGKIDLLACWSEKVGEKPYLKSSLINIKENLLDVDQLKVNWLCLKDTKCNKVLTGKNHPRHLSRLQETTVLQKFDFENYIKNVI